MTNNATGAIKMVALTPLGDAAAAVCNGDFCVVPEHHTQAVVNKRLDEDLV